MRVVILGPVVNENLSGGVGVFDEGLYNGFYKLGDDVFLISLAKSTKINNIVIGNGRYSKRKIFFSFKRISNKIKELRPDIVISSVQYSLGIKKYKRKYKKAKFVQVLHGFPCSINGIFKNNLVNGAARYTRKWFDYVVTVSFLSYAINKKINRIVCDKVIHNGCSLVYNGMSQKRDIDFIYIGRLFRDKEVEMIVDSFIDFKNKFPNSKIVIAGYGELSFLMHTKKFLESGIEYIGKISQEDVKNYLQRSKFFISMNPLEPFGTVFNEALINGCNIITQTTSGGAPLFVSKKYFHAADCTNSKELLDVLCSSFNNYVPVPENDIKDYIEYLSFKRTAQEYKDLIK